MLLGLFLACVLTVSPARASTPTCIQGMNGCYFPGMPFYDQTDPNFAFISVPSVTWSNEAQPMSSGLQCGSAVVANPYYTTWLPLGPISGDPGSIGASVNCGWWYTALCGPTSESMALIAAIKQASTTTTISGWTQTFFSGTTPSGQVGTVPNPMFTPTANISASGTPNRGMMGQADIQRIILMAINQGTSPVGGGDMNAILQTAGDFSPAAVGANGDPNTISNSTFTQLIKSGNVIVFAIHDYTAHLQIVTRPPPQVGKPWKPTSVRETLSFTYNGGGHILTVNGEQSGTLKIYDPVYAQIEWLTMEYLNSGTASGYRAYLGVPATLSVQLPNSQTAIAIWPDSAHPISSPWDVQDGQVVTFIDGFVNLYVQ